MMHASQSEATLGQNDVLKKELIKLISKQSKLVEKAKKTALESRTTTDGVSQHTRSQLAMRKSGEKVEKKEQKRSKTNKGDARLANTQALIQEKLTGA